LPAQGRLTRNTGDTGVEQRVETQGEVLMNSFDRKVVRRKVRAFTLSILCGATALSLALVAPVYAAAANISRFTVTTPFTDTLFDDCTGLAGTLAGTDVVTGQTVATGTGFHFEGTQTDTLVITLSDGSYAPAQSLDHLSFNADAGVTVFTTAHVDSLTFYSADGQVLYSETFRLVEHNTITRDDVVRVEFEIGHLSGGC
jgi:hypothetical protein